MIKSRSLKRESPQISMKQSIHSTILYFNLAKSYVSSFTLAADLKRHNEKPRRSNMVSALMSLDMEGPRQILGTGTCELAGRSSSLDTCFRFLENHSHRHPWARFRFKGKARPVTTVSVYNKTRPPAAIKHGRECSGNRITLVPSSPPREVFVSAGASFYLSGWLWE